MAFRIAVCDDAPIDCAYAAGLAREWAALRGLNVQLECFSSAEAFLFRYAECRAFDLLLLDVELGGMDGVQLARRIRAGSETVQIVFLTGYSDYIAEGYDVSALHYLVKPVHREKLFPVLDRAMERLKTGERFLTLECAGTLCRIPLREIRYLDVHQNYVTVHARQDYTVKRTLRELSGALDSGFFRAGRSLILNLHQVRRVARTEVTLEGGTVLPLPRGCYDALCRAVIEET